MQVVKYGLLGLLEKEPRHGYELKSAFEDLLGGSWPLNIGQVYSTLARLERDGLVEVEVVAQDPFPDRKVYSITQSGRDDLAQWADEPVEVPLRLRDELVLKVVLQSQLGDAGLLIAHQRQRYFQALAELSAAREHADPATRLLVDGSMLHIEADLKWLELFENHRGS